MHILVQQIASHYQFYFSASIECRTRAAKKQKDMHLFSGIGLCNHLGRIFLIENQNIPWCLTNLQIEKSTSALCSNIAGERPEKFKILFKLYFSAFIKLQFSELRLRLVLYGSICCVDGQNLLLRLLLAAGWSQEHRAVSPWMLPQWYLKTNEITEDDLSCPNPTTPALTAPFLMECGSLHRSSQWRRAEHSPCSDRGRHCSKGNTETCDYALTAVLPACWTAGNFFAVSLIYISQPCLYKVPLIIY